MVELSATILAAEEAAEGPSNFLIPNGTFFVILIIFLIVLGVITKWVVPPISKVLAEREAMLAKTAADNKKSAEQVAAAQADYDAAMAGARGEASAIRDEARAEGRQVVDEARAEASGEVAETVRTAVTSCPRMRRPHRPIWSPRWKVFRPRWPSASSGSTASELLEPRVEPLMSTFIGQLIGFGVIVFLLVKFVVPPVRTMMKKQQDAVRQALADSATAAQTLSSADETHASKLEEARSQADKVTAEARNDSTRITEQLREQAVIDAERIKAQGGQQVNLLHQQTIRGLTANLGAESIERAEEIVRAHVADPAAQSATVDRFLDELDAMSPSTAVTRSGRNGQSAGRQP